MWLDAAANLEAIDFIQGVIGLDRRELQDLVVKRIAAGCFGVVEDERHNRCAIPDLHADATSIFIVMSEWHPTSSGLFTRFWSHTPLGTNIIRMLMLSVGAVEIVTKTKDDIVFAWQTLSKLWNGCTQKSHHPEEYLSIKQRLLYAVRENTTAP